MNTAPRLMFIIGGFGGLASGMLLTREFERELSARDLGSPWSWWLVIPLMAGLMLMAYWATFQALMFLR